MLNTVADFPITVHGTSGEDTIRFGGVADVLAFDGNDTIIFDGPSAGRTIDGGPGQDTLVYNTRTGLTFDLEQGAVWYTEYVGTGVWIPGVGSPVYEVRVEDSFSAVEKVLGGYNGDTMIAASDGSWMSGRGGRDTMLGGDGNDRIFAGDDADVIVDGGGIDRMSGGAGADRFFLVADGSNDRIVDFDPEEDRLELAAWGADGIDDLDVRFVRNRTIVTFEDERLVLNGHVTLTADNAGFETFLPGPTGGLASVPVPLPVPLPGDVATDSGADDWTGVL